MLQQTQLYLNDHLHDDCDDDGDGECAHGYDAVEGEFYRNAVTVHHQHDLGTEGNWVSILSNHFL